MDETEQDILTKSEKVFSQMSDPLIQENLTCQGNRMVTRPQNNTQKYMMFR